MSPKAPQKPFEDILKLVGAIYLVSDWVTVSQERIDAFADVTGDHQWLHVDVERAKRESPYGQTIAHGLLVLTLLPGFTVKFFQDYRISRIINYGSEKVRFPAPVLSGSKVRASFVLKSAEEAHGGYKLTSAVTVEADNQDRPVCYAENVLIAYPLSSS